MILWIVQSTLAMLLDPALACNAQPTIWTSDE